MAWIGAVRAGCDPVALLSRARIILSDRVGRFYPNFYPTTGGGGIEQAGVTLAVRRRDREMRGKERGQADRPAETLRADREIK